MKIFAISDLHLGNGVEKPMDVFGKGWENHFGKISDNWNETVSEDDLVLLGGDISWGLTLDEAEPDYNAVAALPGKKIVVRGNHDYYWNSLSKMQNKFPSFGFIQNNSLRVGGALIAGTRGWTIADETSSDEDKKIYARELQRLELSLSSLSKKRSDGDFVVALMHYPPFNADYSDSGFTCILEKYGVDAVTYGHLHGKNVRATDKLIKNGIPYYLTSCDLIDNKLVKIGEVL